MIHTTACGPGDWPWMAQVFGRRWGHHGRNFWSGALHDPPPRAERGEIRFLVLDAIKERARHGYEVIQHIEQRAGGSYRPSPGVIYPTLQMLEELGQARIVEQEGRKAYEITDVGRQELEANARSVEDFYERFGEEPFYAEEFAEVMRRVAHLVKAFKRGAQRGRMTPEALRAIRVALDEALTRIEDALNAPRR
ncbi:MAG TPA: PadR family transcriptional regulator [Polyangiaceae bacterium]